MSMGFIQTYKTAQDSKSRLKNNTMPEHSSNTQAEGQQDHRNSDPGQELFIVCVYVCLCVRMCVHVCVCVCVHSQARCSSLMTDQVVPGRRGKMTVQGTHTHVAVCVRVCLCV